MEPVLKKITKVGIIVKNLYETLDYYYNRYGINNWNIWEQNPDYVKDQMVNGVKTKYSAFVAHSKIGDTIWEIIEPLNGDNIYAEFLKKHGEGIHHLGYEVEEMNQSLDFFKDYKIKMLQSGSWNGLRYAFFDTNVDLKHTVEIYNIPKNFEYPKPISCYPDKSIKNLLRKPLLKEVRQIGIAVKNIKKTAQLFNDKYMLGPWKLYKYFFPKVINMQYDGLETQDQKFTAGTTTIDNIGLELVEPESGKNIYTDFINKYGEGIQHISFIYNCTFKESSEFHKKNGQTVKQSGSINNAIYAYFTTEKDLKFTSEHVYIPPNFAMSPCDYSYPNN